MTRSEVNSGGGGYAQGGGAQAMMAGMMDPNSLMANPMVKDMAMQYGAQFTQQGQEQIQKHLDKDISIGQLKYYFAVDTSYVARKLAILLFPVSDRPPKQIWIHTTLQPVMNANLTHFANVFSLLAMTGRSSTTRKSQSSQSMMSTLQTSTSPPWLT